MLLRPGDGGDAVKALQRNLNKLGSILLVDGDFGPATRDAVTDARGSLNLPGAAEADDSLQEALAGVPDPFPPLGAPGVTFIARAEVSGPREYRRKYQSPVWPTAKSGITIGIGYDLQFFKPEQFRADWQEHLPPPAIETLCRVLGTRGSAERLAQVRSVNIPLPAAMSVFLRRTLPRYLQNTRSIYPQIDTLPPARRTALVSLIYNRGTRLEDADPVREERREMRTIQALLAAGDENAVADQLESMARLWEEPGLIQRRRDEARLWRAGFAVLQLD